jgi:membrane-associated protein
MSLLPLVMEIFLHTDKYLINIIKDYGLFTYAILFLVIFIETGIVVMPFLPGDSLLFVAGTLAATGSLSLLPLLIILMFAAIIGDSLNYSIGKYLGPKVFNQNIRFLKKEHLIATQKFYEKHGGKTIIIARFMPFFRTFAPFVAGIGSMKYINFLLFNIFGGILWVGSLTLAGFFFGNISFVKNNLTLIILIIIFLSILPGIISYITRKRN